MVWAWALLRALLRALRRHRAGRGRVPLARLTRGRRGSAPAPSRRRAARRLLRSWTESGLPSSRPPAGRRLAVKDLFDTAGVRTTYGSAVFSDYVPAATAERCSCSKRPAGLRPGRRTCTSSPTASPRRTSTTGSCRTRVPRAGPPAARAAGRLRRSHVGLADGRARNRHRRLDPHSGGVLRRDRLQAELRPRLGRRGLPARAELRPCRADGARRCGLRRADAGAGAVDDAACALRPARRRHVGRPVRPPRPRTRARGCGRLRRGHRRRVPDRRGRRTGVHARGGRRPPGALRRARRVVRRQHHRQGRALPRPRRRSGRAGAGRTRGA